MKGKWKLFCCLVSGMLTAALNGQAQQFFTLTQAGNFISSEKVPHGYGIQTTDAYISLTSYGATTIRIQFLKNKEEANKRSSFAVIAQPEQDLYLKDSSGGKLTLETDSLRVTINREPVRINFFSKRTGQLLSGDDEILGMTWNGSEVTSYRKMFSDEKFLGLGQKTGDLNHRSTTLVNLNNDAYGFKASTTDVFHYALFYGNT